MIENQEKKIKWFADINLLLVKMRWLYLSTIAFVGLITKLGLFSSSEYRSNINFPSFWMGVIVFSAYFYNLFFFWYFKRRRISLRGARLMTIAQIGLDQVYICLVTFFAGGLSSISFIYLFYGIIAAAFFYRFAGVFLVSTSASLIYSTVIILQYYDILPYYSRYNFPHETILAHLPAAIIANLIIVVLSFYIVGLFAGIIANYLRSYERDLRFGYEKERAILANLKEGLIFLDNDGLIILVNELAEKMLMIGRGQLIGRLIKELDSPEPDHDLVSSLQQHLAAADQIFSFNQENNNIFYQVAIVPVLGDEQKQIGRVVVIYDHSRDKLVEKMKYEFVKIAGHQLRTPMSAIKSAFNMLAQGEYGQISAEQKDILEKGQTYTDRLIAIVNDLLEVFSIEEGQYDFQFVPADLNKILSEICRRQAAEAEERKINLVFTTASSLPAIPLDEAKIKLALNAIIENGVRYTAAGGTVMVAAKVIGREAVVSVQDSGIGIPAAERDKIFTKFYRAENALRWNTEGNGLQLFVAKNIIDSHGGRVWFSAAPGQGTIFYIALPLAGAD